MAENQPGAVCSINDIMVVGIAGSLRSKSYTRFAVAEALQGAARTGCQVKLLDLRDFDLVFADGDLDVEDYPQKTQELLQLIRQAHGVILGTPEYHGSYSGVLKNALDLMGFDEFEGKMIGLVGVSGGAMGAQGAMTELRSVGRALHSWVIPEQAGVPNARSAFDAAGACKEERIANRLRKVGEQTARFAYLHKCGESDSFLELWQSAPENPGGEG